VIAVDRLPVLGTGKTDYGTIGKLAMAAAAPPTPQTVGALGMGNAKRQEP
jgi:hypothetical protein